MENFRIYKFFKVDEDNKKIGKEYFLKAENKTHMIEKANEFFKKKKDTKIKFYFEIEKLSDFDIEKVSKYFLKYDSSKNIFFKFRKDKKDNLKIIKYNFFTKFVIHKKNRNLAKQKCDEKIFFLHKKKFEKLKNDESGFHSEIVLI